MRKDVVVAVMRAELRLTRRLVRYWIFLTLALVSGLVIYLYYCGLHAFFSSYSATAANIGPRFLIGAMGLYYVAFFLAWCSWPLTCGPGMSGSAWWRFSTPAR